MTTILSVTAAVTDYIGAAAVDMLWFTASCAAAVLPLLAITPQINPFWREDKS